MLKRLDKKGIITEYLPWLLIGVAVLALLLITVFILKGKGFSLIDQIKDLFRGGG
jgi:hypothetical protein